MPDTPQADHEPVDRSVLESLLGRLGAGGPAMLARLLEAWERETARRLADLRASAAGGDADGVATAAHGIRGGSGSMGAVALAEVCGRVEEAIRRHGRVDLDQAHADIAAAVQSARVGLAQLSVGSSG